MSNEERQLRKPEQGQKIKSAKQLSTLSQVLVGSANKVQVQSTPVVTQNVAAVFEDDTSKKIREISKLTHLSEAEILKRAIDLMEVAIDSWKNDQSLAIVDKNDQLTARITGLV